MIRPTRALSHVEILTEWNHLEGPSSVCDQHIRKAWRPEKTQEYKNDLKHKYQTEYTSPLGIRALGDLERAEHTSPSIIRALMQWLGTSWAHKSLDNQSSHAVTWNELSTQVPRESELSCSDLERAEHTSPSRIRALMQWLGTSWAHKSLENQSSHAVTWNEPSTKSMEMQSSQWLGTSREHKSKEMQSTLWLGGLSLAVPDGTTTQECCQQK